MGVKTWKKILMKVSYSASPKSTKPQVENGLKVPYAGAKRSGFKTRWYLLLLLVILPIAAVSWILLRPEVFILSNGIITTEPLEIRAHANGVLTELKVKSGEKIKANDHLLTIYNNQLIAKINILEQQLSMLMVNGEGLNLAILNQLTERISIAQAGMTDQERLVKQYQQFEVKNKGLIPSAEMAMVYQSYIASKIELANSKANLAQEKQRQQVQLSAGNIAIAKNAIELELASLRAMKEQLVTTAPYDSQVVDILVQKGEYIIENQPMLLISGRKDAVIFAYLAPKYFKHAQIGQQATIKLPDGNKLRARITEPTELIGKLPKQLTGPFDGDKPVLKLTLTPDEALPISIEGLPVEVSFDYKFPLSLG